MSLKNRIRDAVEEGEEEASERGAFFAYWWEYFNLHCDPFEQSSLNPLRNDSDSELFINRESEITQLAKLIGQSKHARNRLKVVVVGPTGIGKRSIAHMLVWAIKDADKKGFIFDVGENELVYPEIELKSQKLPEDNDLRFAVFEDMQNLDRARMRFNSYDHRRILVIGFWTPEFVPDDLEYDLEIKLEPMNEDEVKEILIRRIQKCGGNQEILPEDALGAIAEHSRGVPLLALDLATEALRSCYRRRGKALSKQDVLESVERCGYEFKGKGFRQSELRVIRHLARVETTSPNELAKDLSISRVMAWKYLNRYFTDKYLRRKSVGKSYQYELTKPGKVRIQLALTGRRSL